MKTKCVEFTGTKDKDGYGQLSTTKLGTRKAHRWAWMEVNGPIPKGLCVCHKCDNPSCINPDHLFLGTVKDNAKDRDKKGRHYNQKKTHCPKGHEYNKENTYYPPSGGRYCKICDRMRHRV